MAKSNGNRRQIGCAALLTAAVAFPAGLWVAGSSRPEPAAPRAAASPASRSGVRNPYSANVRSDPYVLERQRALVEALESDCRRSGNHCPEADQARRYIDARASKT